ncbi:MAG: type I restriction endonuclease subunit M [Saprospiraceae bacterium]|nr:type I restriction endonuclease subunit M [Saprospiraceae bacterium]
MTFLSDTVSAFETGSLFMTSTVFGATCEHRPFAAFIRQCIARHQSQDWGDCCPDDAALLDGSRIFSVYVIPAGLYTLESKVWIITESSREYTTVLFPSEY